jgi:hypothetical protein
VAAEAEKRAGGVTCLWCGGSVPLPEGGEETFCVDCGKGYRFLDRVEVWFNQYIERYVPA